MSQNTCVTLPHRNKVLPIHSMYFQGRNPSQAITNQFVNRPTDLSSWCKRQKIRNEKLFVHHIPETVESREQEPKFNLLYTVFGSLSFWWQLNICCNNVLPLTRRLIQTMCLYHHWTSLWFISCLTVCRLYRCLRWWRLTKLSISISVTVLNS